MKKHLFFFICCILHTVSMQAQSSYGIDIPVRQSQLPGQQSAGDIYNVDKFTGTAHINIPIFSYSSEGLDQSIYLSYHTKGIKVDEVASTVGLGWNLNAGGYIERVVNGYEDEMFLTNPGYLDKMGLWREGDRTDDATKDNENDLFIVNVGGKTASFTINFPTDKILRLDHMSFQDKGSEKMTYVLLDNNGDPFNNGYSASEMKYSITGTGPNDPVNLMPVSDETSFTFMVRDNAGNKFYFTKRDHRYKYVDIYDANNNKYSVLYVSGQRWWLTKVVTRDGSEIFYTYDVSSNIDYPEYMNDQLDEEEGFAYGSNQYSSGHIFPSQSEETWSGKLHRVKSISYPTGVKVDFEYEGGRCDIPDYYFLKYIKVSSGYDNSNSNLSVKNTLTYQFNYAYFHYNGEVSLSSCAQNLEKDYRLKLKSIDKYYGSSSNSQLYYSFEYDPVQLPPRLTARTDLYGYYNNKPVQTFTYNSNTYTLGVPYHQFEVRTSPLPADATTYTVGVDKTPDFNYLKACVLTKVKNGMGGEITFYYKAHSLSGWSEGYTPVSTLLPSSNNTYDGLCLDKIKYHDGFNNDNDKIVKYQYSNGKIFFQNLYFYYPTLMDPGNLSVLAKKWRSNIVSPIDYVNGCNHGYSNVTEIIEGYNGEEVSKTEYYFSNIINNDENYSAVSIGSSRLDNYKGDYYSITFPATSFIKSEIGLPLNIKTYVGNTLSSHTINEYFNISANQGYSQRACFGVSFWQNTGPWYTVKSGNPSLYENYYLWDGLYRQLKSTITLTHLGSDIITDQKTFTYSGRYLTKTHFTNSRGESFDQEQDYVFSTDFQDAYPAKSSLWKYISSTDRVVMSYTEAIPDNVLYPSKFIKVRSSKLSAPASSIANANVSTDMEIVRFDDKKNPIEIKTDDRKYSASIYDTRIGLKIAEVANAKYTEIAYTSFEGHGQGTSSSTYDRGNWEFNAANVTTTQAFTGKYSYTFPYGTSDFIWTDGINGPHMLTVWATSTPKVFKDATQIDVHQAKQGFGEWKLFIAEIPDGLNYTVKVSNVLSSMYIDEVRLYPKHALMTTYTYSPLIGPLSVTDANNNVTFTEYDVKGNPVRNKDTKGKILQETSYTILGNDN